MRRNGFTLVEMLIALTIFGMLTAAGVALLSVSVRTQETSDRLVGEAADLRRFSVLLVNDLSQAAPRRWRDENGVAQPAFAGQSGAEGTRLLALVRRGWDNPDVERRSSLQRVIYRVSGGQLERLAFPHVDGGGEAVAVPLIATSGVRVRFRDPEGQWRDIWDPLDPSAMPRAVEVVALTERYGEVRQVVVVGGGT